MSFGIQIHGKHQHAIAKHEILLSLRSTSDDISGRGFLCFSEILKNLPAPPILYGFFELFRNLKISAITQKSRSHIKMSRVDRF